MFKFINIIRFIVVLFEIDKYISTNLNKL
jgi:hypothetical protein